MVGYVPYLRLASVFLMAVWVISSPAQASDNLVLESFENIQKALSELNRPPLSTPCEPQGMPPATCDLFSLGSIPNPPMDTENFGKITRYWAQTNAGADLAHDHMRELIATGERIPEIPVGACDGG